MMASSEIAPQGSAPPRVDRGTDIVTVFVGPDKYKFTVHKNPICASSQFFKRAFEGGFTEGVSQELTLPEEKQCLFKFFCDWLYMSEYSAADWSKLKWNTEYEQDAQWLLLYHMGGRLMIPGIQILALRQFTKIFSPTLASVPTEELMTIIYEPDANEIIRNYIVKHVAHWVSQKGDWEKWTRDSKFTTSFYSDMAFELGSKFRGANLLRPASHPSEGFVKFAGSQGLDLLELCNEARAADTKTLYKGSALSSMFLASQEHKRES
jgi:hypothetical protein